MTYVIPAGSVLFRVEPDKVTFHRSGNTLLKPRTLVFERKEPNTRVATVDQVGRLTISFQAGDVDADGSPIRARDSLSINCSKAVAISSPVAFQTMVDEAVAMLSDENFVADVMAQLLPNCC